MVPAFSFGQIFHRLYRVEKLISYPSAGLHLRLFSTFLSTRPTFLDQIPYDGRPSAGARHRSMRLPFLFC